MKPFQFLLPGRDSHSLARKLIMMFATPGNFLYGLPDRFGIDDQLATIYEHVSKINPFTSKKEFQIIPGVEETLSALYHRYPMAIVSARGEKSSMLFLSQYNLQHRFVCIATARTTPKTKPYPDPIYWTAEQMQVHPEACLMIGDTSVDIRSAKAAGAQAIGVLCGFGGRKELERAGADMIIDTTSDIRSLLLN